MLTNMKRGIICIETEWQITKKKNRLSLNSEPLLRFLDESYGIPFIYRRIATQRELIYYLKQFCKNEYAKYEILYFSFHGQTHGIKLEGEKELLSLNDLLEIGGDIFKNRIVHFSSCRTLLGSQKSIDVFKDNSGAKAVSGYPKSVDSVLSAIHDIALFRECQERKQIPAIFRRLESMHEGLQKELGFRTHSY